MLQWPLNPGKLWLQNEAAVTVLLLKATMLEIIQIIIPEGNPRHVIEIMLIYLYTYGVGRIILKHECAKEVCAEDTLPSFNVASKQAVETI